jgi:hypothetical protein
VSSLSECLFKTVGRHFVTLSCVQLQPGKAEKKLHVFSGFLLGASGVWFYVTAGHILSDIRESLALGGEFDIWRLDDQTAGNRFKGAAIPYVFDINRWLVIEDKEVGLDYAAVPLDTFYWRQLKAGGAIPIGKEAWGNPFTDRGQWALVGIPSETVAYDQESIITAGIVVMPLERAEEPMVAGRKAENQFYARLADLGNVKDIEGMSGGPVFAVEEIEGKWKYKVIGVQSGWYRSARTIAACPIASFAAMLERLVERRKASIEPSADTGQAT